MRVEGKALPAIWKHKDFPNQFVAALTRTRAMHLVKAITGNTLDKDNFVRTGDFGYREMIMSTDYAYKINKVITNDFYSSLQNKVSRVCQER